MFNLNLFNNAKIIKNIQTSKIMETLIIILIVVMTINDFISIGVYFKNNLDKRQTLALQETVNKAQEAFLHEKKRMQDAIDNRDKTIKEWVQKRVAGTSAKLFDWRIQQVKREKQ